MKKFIDLFLSIRASITLMIVFATAIGYATFVENSNGTPAAKALVYNAVWFEVLLILLIINLIGIIFRTKLIQKKKWGVLMFHSAFICILMGSAITRYFGYEGIMHIRQGKTSNTITTDKTALIIRAEYQGVKTEKATEAVFSPTTDNTFAETLQVGGKTITVENTMFVPNAHEMLEAGEEGEPAVSLFFMTGADQSMDMTLFGEEKNEIGGLTFGFAGGKDSADVSFSVENNALFFKSNLHITKAGTMASGMIDRDNATPVTPGHLCPGEENTVYRIGHIVFMIKGFLPHATKTLTQVTPTEDGMNQGTDALILSVKGGNTERKINVFKDENPSPIPTTCYVDGVKVSVAYGKMTRTLPFSLTLRAFQLDRYQGSMSPSSYASEITLRDTERKSEQPYRIFMNNILNYRGYRFFQSSYDEDEMGTILSVNHDYWGTFVTYIGYILLLIGMILSLFDKKSRFQTLMKMTTQLQQKRKTLTMIALLLLSGSSFTAGKAEITKQEHLDAFSSLLIQDGVQGRIEPVSTYASDVLRKIYKKSSFRKQSPEEVLLGMIANPAAWKKEQIIKVSHEQLAKELGAVDGYVSYSQLFDDKTGSYKLSGIVDKAYIKDQSQRNTYEKEVVYVDERFNICSQIFDGTLLTIFPEKGTTDGKWMTAHGKMSTPDPSMGACTRNQHTPLSMFSDAGTTPTSKPDSPEMLLKNYYLAVNSSTASGNWDASSGALAALKAYQLKNGGEILPSNTKIKLEILYNKWNLFGNLAYIYFAVGSILLGLHLLNIFRYSKRLENVLEVAIYPLTLLFIIYTTGMGLRWYISGHAPWSNGYESMIFVGWASGLSGLVFARKSPMAFSVTALLSATALIVAGMSWMNPEITNLVPVLKSYWLVVHVAVITSSYGFFAMAMILGLVNLVLMIAKNQKNGDRLKENIKEISYIIEMALIVGLFLMVVGNFLGAVWANESWGRYWGWDAKETWALASILVYAVILHVRMIPGGNQPFILSSLSVVGFSSIIMTFLGVNYYLSGMHSYGKGTPPPLPNSLFITIITITILIGWALRAENKNGAFQKTTGEKQQP